MDQTQKYPENRTSLESGQWTISTISSLVENLEWNRYDQCLLAAYQNPRVLLTYLCEAVDF